MDGAELLRRMREKGVVLYGTGFVARTFYEILRRRGEEGCLLCCAVTKGGGEWWNGLEVVEWPRLPERVLARRDRPMVCIAVHEAVEPEIRRLVEATWPGECVWIYPWLFSLAFGQSDPPRRIAVAEIMARQSLEDYWIAVRYAALEGREIAACGGVDQGREIYLKTQSVFSSPETARRRLERFYEMAAGFARRGFDPAYPIIMDREYRVVDGLHRLAMSLYYGVREIPCALVEPSPLYGALFGEGNRVTRAAQEKAGLDAREKAVLEQVHRCLLAVGRGYR